MARGRMLSKSLSTSRKFRALLEASGKRREFDQVLYTLIIAHSDDFGRLEGDPFTIKALCYPTSPRPQSDFEDALRAMNDVGLIVLYEVASDHYVQVVQFDEHQSGRHKRTRSRFPEPPADSANFPEVPSEEKGTEQKGRERNGNGAEAHPPASVSKQEAATEGLLRVWREVCVPVGLADIRVVDEDLRRKCRCRLAEEPSLAAWLEVFTRVAASSFCRGEGLPQHGKKKPWRADFRWIVENASNGAKVLEGRYDDATTSSAGEFVG